MDPVTSPRRQRARLGPPTAPRRLLASPFASPVRRPPNTAFTPWRRLGGRLDNYGFLPILSRCKKYPTMELRGLFDYLVNQLKRGNGIELVRSEYLYF
ncbi:hypothetical protein Taro_017362 [Colocasia esculenta]|uniref:Uncharacterized protein n=1 Tax=Colocasia esculenta TaxID=4460 RepID=A0A843UT00_COLES|nr:hypothetical protein [Colocasia esculenta]